MATAADLVVIIHLCYLMFTLGGTLLILVGRAAKFRWIRNRLFRRLHLAAVLVVPAEAVFGLWCPLTILEYRLRRLAGQAVESDISFVGRLVRKILFYDLPDWVFLVLYIVFAVLVLITYICIPPRKKNNFDT